MKMVEISYRAQVNQIEKLTARLERAEKKLEKAEKKAEKFGVKNWTNEQRREWLNGVEKNGMWIANKKDVDKNGAWFDYDMAKEDLERVKESIEFEMKKLAKAEQKLEEYREEVEQIQDLKAREELRKKSFENEQKEWLKDGIILEKRYFGTTPNGKRFGIVGNCGWSERSMHCFTLYIDGKTIFTSGEFWRAYQEIKRS